LAKLDQRTKEAALMRQTRAALTAHVGEPSAVQTALIERATWLTLRVAQLDAKMAGGAAFTEHDSRTYLAWSNSLGRTLRELQPASPAREVNQVELVQRMIDRHRRSGAAL
jgi:hypothetical protein